MSFDLREHPTSVFLLVAVICYLLALGTSYALVKWLVPAHWQDPASKGRHVAIDGLRGYLAFSVCLHHCLATWMFLPHGQWDPLPHNFENELGATSVTLFFMITAWLFWSRAQANRIVEWRSFFITRFFRIYPLYLFVMLLICLVVGSHTHWSALESPGALTREIGKWLLFRDPDINLYYRTTLIVKGVTWTLLYEAWFYLSLPVLVLLFLRRTAVWIKVVAFGIVGVLAKINHIDLAIAATFLGSVFAVYWRLNKTRIDAAQSGVASVVALASLSAVVFLLYKPFNPTGIILLTVFFVVIASGNTLFGFLKTRSAVWLGEISYSVYLCHGLVLWVIMQKIIPHMHGFDHSMKWFAISSIGMTPIVILFCSATYLMIERPSIAVGHQIASRGLMFPSRYERRSVDAVQMG